MNIHQKAIINKHLPLVIAITITLLVYFRFFFYGPISWDDPEMVFKNKDVQNFNIQALFTKHYVGNYIPITMLLHSISWLLFENNAWGHHFINILFHILNGILVYKAGSKLFKNDFIANIGAMVFLLHPLQVESVGWISELKNVLSATFYLLSVLAYINYNERGFKRYYLFAFLYFILACLSKSSAVVLPVLFMAIDFFLYKKINLNSFLNKIPFLVIAVIIGIVNIKTQTADQFINYSHAFPYAQRVALAGFALFKYLILFIFPLNLSVIYPYPELKILVFALGMIFLMFLIGACIYLLKRKKSNTLFILSFIIVNLILILQFLPFGEALYADRYMYLPLVGFGWLLAFVLSKIKLRQNILVYGLMFCFSIITFNRAGAWKNALTLYEDILKKYPTQFIALNSAGVESMRLDSDEKSLEYFNKAVKYAPRNYKGYYNRGLLYLKKNKPELAIKSFNQTLALYDYPKAYIARASAYYALSDLPKAINDANHVLTSEPNNAKAHFVLGNCYDDLNRLEEALREYNKCIELNGNDAEYYFKRAIVFGKKQDFLSCKNDLSLCIELNSNYYPAYYWRGVAKVNLKENPCDDLRIAAQNNVKQAGTAYSNYCK